MNEKYIEGEAIFRSAVDDLSMAPEIEGYICLCKYKDGKVGYAWDVGKESMDSLISLTESVKMRIIHNNSTLFDNEDEDEEDGD